MLSISWNVNGLRAVARKGFVEWLSATGPDLCLLQETKARADDLPKKIREVPGYVSRFHHAEKKGYSGVAIYARKEPDEWIEGIGDPEYDSEGRVLWARYGDVLYGSAYFPNSQEAGKRIDYRLGFGKRLLGFLAKQRKAGRHVVLGGDYNVSHQEIDLARPKQNTGNPGFLPAEREWFGEFLKAGYVDTWRQRNPDVTDVYSWWSYRHNAREKNIGWRLDYFCVNEELLPRVKDARILCDVEGSDHCPVTVEVE